MSSSNLIFPLVALFALTFGTRMTTGTWASPAPYFAALYAFIAALDFSSPLWGAQVYPVSVGAMWWVWLGVAMFCVGTLVGQAGSGELAQRKRLPNGIVFPGIAPLIALSVTSGLIFVFFYSLIDDPENPPLRWQAVLPLHYAAPILGGILFASTSNRRDRLIALSTILPGLLAALIFTRRTAVVYAVTYWFAGYCATQVLISRRPIALFTWWRAVMAVLIFFLFLASAVVLQSLRVVLDYRMSIGERLTAYSDAVDEESLQRDWEFMQPGIFGAMSAFSIYFDAAWVDPPPVQPGRYTFAGILRAFGATLDAPDYVVVDGVGTNAFIMHKSLISDYGFWGSLAAFFGYGWIAGWAYKRVSAGSFWAMTILFEVYTNATIGGGIFLNYNSITAAFVILGVYLHWVERHAAPGQLRLVQSARAAGRFSPAGLRRSLRHAGAPDPRPKARPSW